MRKLFSLVAILVLCLGQLLAQTTRTVTGTVTDEKGSPLTGATITAISADKKAVGTAVTDAKGMYSLKITDKAKSLQISYVGLDDQTVNLGSKSSYAIVLASSSNKLDEVVVV